jgi:ATP-binding cassette, subfamily B, bacterial PglK
MNPGFWEALRQLFHFMSPRRRRQFYFVLFLMLLGAVAELVAIGAVFPFLSLLADISTFRRLPVVADISGLLGIRTPDQLLLLATAFFAAAALAAGAVRLQLAWSSQAFIFRLGHDLGVEVQRRVLSQPYSYHIQNNTSHIVASLEKVQVLVYYILLQLMLAATAAVIAAFIVAALFYIEPVTAALAAMGFGAVYAAVSAFTRERLARNSVAATTAYSQRVQIIQEGLGGIRDVILDQSERVYLEDFERADRKLNFAKTNTAFIGAAPRFVIESAGMILIGVVALFLTSRDGGLTAALPVLGALALGAQRLLPLFQQVYQSWTLVVGSWGVVEDVLRLLNLPAPETRARERAAPLPFTREIRFERVSFSYPGRSEAALSDIEFTIPPGSRVALVGTTGSGKSTLIDLLMGLLPPDEGVITVDGVSIAGEARRRWQSSIAHVPQMIFLADTSIERNIAFGYPPSGIDHELVVAAARQAQLHEFVKGLPEGYDTFVGERGVRLSGGQRQRLGIARALYKRASVLVLDEATSALDQETEAAVMGSLHGLDSEITIIMIAHRLSTIAICDTVIRLENGRIAKTGSYAEVVGGTPLEQTS